MAKKKSISDFNVGSAIWFLEHEWEKIMLYTWHITKINWDDFEVEVMNVKTKEEKVLTKNKKDVYKEK